MSLPRDKRRAVVYLDAILSTVYFANANVYKLCIIISYACRNVMSFGEDLEV